MMLVNWSIEAVKWKYMIGKIERVGFFKAFYAVLTGGGKLIHAEPDRGVFRKGLCPRQGQQAGGHTDHHSRQHEPAAGHHHHRMCRTARFHPLLARTARIHQRVPAVYPRCCDHRAGSVLVGLFLNISFLSSLKEKILRSRLKRLRKFFRVFAFFHSRELFTILGMSYLRYLVFASQFYLLLRLFAVPVPYTEALMVISLIYFVMAVIPTILITELGIRGSVSIYFFAIYFGSSLADPETVNFGILAASTLLWFINVGIPALIGTLFVYSGFTSSANPQTHFPADGDPSECRTGPAFPYDFIRTDDPLVRRPLFRKKYKPDSSRNRRLFRSLLPYGMRRRISAHALKASLHRTIPPTVLKSLSATIILRTAPKLKRKEQYQ